MYNANIFIGKARKDFKLKIGTVPPNESQLAVMNLRIMSLINN